MSGLSDARVRGYGMMAWPLLVVLVLDMAACSSGQAPEQPGPGPTPSVSGSDSGRASQQPVRSGAAAKPPSQIVPSQPGTVAFSREVASRLPVQQRIGLPHSVSPVGSMRGIKGNDRVPVLAARVPQSASRALRMARPGADADLASYIARVSATDRIELPGAKGMLTVWIGLAQNLPDDDSGTASSTQSLGMRGQTATVTPFAPDFDVDPARTVCERVVPSGSVVRFALSPKQAGDLTVGANVQLFDSADCSGVPVPKSTSLIRIQVRVCRMCYVQSGLASMGQAAWSAFSHFWTWLLGVIFLTLGVLVNRWRRRKFHITKDDEEPKPGVGT